MAASWNIFLYPKPRLPPQGPADQGQMGAEMGEEEKEPGSHNQPSQHMPSIGSPYPDTQRHILHATVTHQWTFMATLMNHRSQVLEEDIQSHINTSNKHIDDYTHSLSTQSLTPLKSLWALGLSYQLSKS